MKLMRVFVMAMVLAASCLPLAAFKFFPISMDFSPTGPGSVSNFQAVNDTDQTIALKIAIFSRSMDETGKDVLVESPEAFQVYPARLVLKKDQQQRIRVQFRGSGPVSSEQAYRIVVEQVPVEFVDQDKSAGLRILFRYIGSLYILPEKPAHKIVVTSLDQVNPGLGPQLRITLENQGNAHVILNKLSLEVRSGNKTVVITPEQLAGLDGSNILPGIKRIISIPWPEGLVAGELSAQANFEPAR